MKLLSSLLFAVTVYATGETDCKAMREGAWPGTSINCPQLQECSDGHLCEVSATNCNYRCVVPIDCATPCQTMSVAIEDAAAELCVCGESLPELPYSYDCDIINGRLSVSVEVPEINRVHPEDDREITLVSGATAAVASQAAAAGTQVDVFGESSCIGVNQGNNVVFTDIVDGVNQCSFGASTYDMVNGTKYEIYQFAVGYDDMIQQDPFNNTVVKRYGKHWNLGCRIKSSDIPITLPIDGSGEHNSDQADPIDVDYDFSLVIYTNSSYTTAYDGDTNISAISTEPASVYVEAKVDAVGKYLHLKECSVNVLTEINNVTDPTLTESFMFIENGCLMTYGAGPTASIGQFISDNFDMSSNRIDSNGDLMINRDQFVVDVWDYDLGLPAGHSKTYTLECILTACSEFGTQEPLCEVNPMCPARYDEMLLQGLSGRRRRQVGPGTDSAGLKYVQASVKFSSAAGSFASLILVLLGLLS